MHPADKVYERCMQGVCKVLQGVCRCMQGVCPHQTRPSDKRVGLIKSIRLDQDASRSCIALSLHRDILICVYMYPKSAGRSEGDLMAIGDYSYDDKGAVFLTRREPMGDYLSYVERYARRLNRLVSDSAASCPYMQVWMV